MPRDYQDHRGVELHTDKGESGYIPTYKGLAATLPEAVNICELGVYQGGSLLMWRDLFPHAQTIVGVDIDPQAYWPRGAFKIIADQQDPGLPGQLKALIPPGHKYHLIVDDASHLGHQTYKSLQHLWPLVAPGGYYVIEDWCVWNGHHGSQWDRSMLSLAQMLPGFFDAPDTEVYSISYIYGMIVMRKKDA